METRPLGPFDASIIGLGCNNFGMRVHDQSEVDAIINTALDAGITYFDTADIYGGGGTAEEMLGLALRDRRDEAVVATKFGHARHRGEDGIGASAPFAKAALEASLSRLGVETIDHYQLHEPDDQIPIVETLGALNEMITEGKVRTLGCSNFTAAQLAESVEVADANNLQGFATVQNRYSLLSRSPETDGVLETARLNGIGFVPFFPLESGLLTGKIRRDEDLPADSRLAAWSKGPSGEQFLGGGFIDATEDLIAFSETRGHTILELAFSWLTSRPGITTVIAGATTPEQVRSNVGSIGWELTDDELAEVDRIVIDKTQSESRP